MLKEQFLKEYKPPSNKTFYISIFVLAVCICCLISVIIICVSRASSLAAIENLSLLDLTKLDINQNYKGTTVIALEYLFRAFTYSLPCIFITIPMCFAPYTRRKQKKLLSLINQIPDEI